MATKLTKAKEMELACVVRDKGKFRPLVLTVFPTGEYLLRPKGTRKDGPAEVAGRFSAEYNTKAISKYLK